MVGQVLKDTRYKLFEPAASDNEKIYFNPQVVKIKENIKYMRVYGKLLAHTILKKQFLGVEFIAPFFKVLYQESINFEDLSFYFDKNIHNNYAVLKNLSRDDLDAMETYFNIYVDKNSIDLKEQGSNIKVTIENVDEYLDSVSKYYLQIRFEN